MTIARGGVFLSRQEQIKQEGGGKKRCGKEKGGKNVTDQTLAGKAT